MSPRSVIVQVTKEGEHAEALLKFVLTNGYGMLFVTLHGIVAVRTTSARSVVEVRIDHERIGQLTPQMSQRFLPTIRHLHSRGLVTTCWGDIKGSAVAAEVGIDGIKANEADETVLRGEPVTSPTLVAARRIPRTTFCPRGFLSRFNPRDVAPTTPFTRLQRPRRRRRRSLRRVVRRPAASADAALLEWHTVD